MRIAGRRLARTVGVRFLATGEKGATEVEPARVGKRTLEAVVPEGAASGRPTLADGAGRTASAPRLRIVAAERLPRPGSFKLAAASASPRTAFFDARRSVRLRYRFNGYGPVDVRAELVRGGRVVRRWVQGSRAPFVRHSLRWNGLTAKGGAADKGRYRFRVGAAGGGASRAGGFRFYDHRFPVRGRHSYGDRFGVPRSGGRTHEGQDLWAWCGTPLVAARGGTVQFKAHSASLYGHYVVIDGRKTERDYLYSHLARPASVKRGTRVRTGQRIGAVGRSGNARGEGCQLHFEIWPSGWRQGRPLDPLRELRRWDGWS